MALVLALTAAASWGASDFLGGFASRRGGDGVTLSIALATQLIGLIGLTLLAFALGGDALTSTEIVLAAGAGLGGGAGVTLLYRGLAIGTMGVVAPVTGAGAAALPVLFATVTGELPSAVAWVGVVAALGAIVLVSRESAPEPATVAAPARPAVAPPAEPRTTSRIGPPGLLEAIGGGVGFGLLFILLDQVGDDTGLLPLVPMKLAACALLAVVVLLRGARAVPPRSIAGPVLAVGILDNLANVAYLLAVRQGLLALVAVVSSLYPVGTVLLARQVLHERLARHQVLGLGLAGIGIVLIAAG